MKVDIANANGACDSMKNCKECVTNYSNRISGTKYVPCNFIRKNYGVSIWDYKEEYREMVKENKSI